MTPQRITKFGAIDADGLPVSGLLVPGQTPGWPGASDEWTDTNGNNYHSLLVSPPIAQAWAGDVKQWGATDTSIIATIPAGAAGTRAFLAGYYLCCFSLPAATLAAQLVLNGLAFALNQFYLLPTSGSLSAVVNYPLPIPSGALNTAITLTLTRTSGGTLNSGGQFGLYGFYRAE